MHTIEPNLTVSEALAATTARAAGTYDTPGIDTGAILKQVHYQVSAGSFATGGTLDGKVQESDDNVAFTDVAPAIAITQIAAAGAPKLKVRLRQVTKRYVRARFTVAVGTVTFGVVSVYQPTTVS